MRAGIWSGAIGVYVFRAFYTVILLGLAGDARAQDDQEAENIDMTAVRRRMELLQSIKWQDGPTVASMGDIAELQLPDGFRFTDASGARAWAEVTQNPPDPQEVGVVLPKGDSNWFLVFSFDPIGYVRDDEKQNLDADAILKSIQQGSEAGNVERQRRGWPTIQVTGWMTPPSYDPSTNNLVWATQAVSEGEKITNHNTRILGRDGVMSVTLVASPEELNQVLPKTKQLLSGFDYKAGKRYAEFKEGDKVAQYGLTALIAGGAVAVALKTGILQKFGKFIIVGVIALVSVIGRVLGFKKSEA